MDFLSRKNLIIASLLLVIFITFTYSVKQFKNNKDELILQLADITEKIALPYRLVRLSMEERDSELLIPVLGLQKATVADTFGAERPDDRIHEGIDIFAKKGTPVFSATRGYVVRAGTNPLGGNVVFVVGPGGVRYYYAHLDSIADGIKLGKEVTTDTVLGFVGNTGNAETTPPHLHFGVYKRGAENPYPMLIAR